VANTSKDQVGQAATETLRYRSGIELATWHETLANAETTIAQLTARLAVACRRELFATKDEKFRLHRAQISRQLAWLQIGEHCRPGSELNYDERLKALKGLFDTNVRALAERLSVIETGIKTLYGIDLPFGKPEKGQLLDHAGVRLAQVSDELAKWRRTQRLSILSVPCLGTMKVEPSGSLKAEFTIDEAAMPDQHALLRGVNLEFVGNGSGPISAALTPPQVLTTGSHGPLLFGRVCSVAPGLDLRPQHSDLLWNGNPFGTWRVTGWADPSLATPNKLVLYLWIASL
jgi:hypothetical protein